MGNTTSSAHEPLQDDQHSQATRSRHGQRQSVSRERAVGRSQSGAETSRTRGQPHHLSSHTDSRILEHNSIEERIYEHEDSPLVPQLGNVASGDSSGEALNRRYSTISRLGSRILSGSVTRGLLRNSESRNQDEQGTHGSFSNRDRSNLQHRRISMAINDQLSSPGSFRRRMEPRLEPRRRSVGNMFPSATDHESLHDGLQVDSRAVDEPQITSAERGPVGAAGGLERTRTRMNRVRSTLSYSLNNILGNSQNRNASRQRRDSPSLRPSRIGLVDDSDQLLPPLNGTDHRIDLDDAPHELDAVEPETRNVLSSSRITSGMSTIRRFPHGLRSRSTRLIRRGEHPPLSQVLQLAAAAIAAQLSGNSPNRTEGVNTIGADAFDGSIQNFVQTLQDAASAQAGENIDLNAPDGDLPPVNFMRVFQFPNDENGAPMAAQARAADMVDFDITNGNNEGDRSVTLVLVGVRSMPHVQEGSSGENGTLGPSLDTLLSLPFLPPANILRNGSSGALFRRSDTRVRPQNRRHSMTNFNFPQQYESQRHQRTRTTAARGLGDPDLLTPNHNSPTPISESPPGPHPPPSTPADMRSGHATPNRRPSSASAAQASILPHLSENQAPEVAPNIPDSSFNTARQRRRSDSEFARRPELSSGNSRRNGVVEPDRSPTSGGRSWLIYVVGTNVSPDHPAFTMPSLFTDNPSYEDMQMLSTLLGPVKPPVATQDDIDTAGGLYRIVMQDNALIAQPVNGAHEHVISVARGERCLICLCEYEEFQQVRQIDSCRHMYHRECIDEWLTTGRNSCPMCRGQGVKERNESNSGTNPAAADETRADELTAR